MTIFSSESGSDTIYFEREGTRSKPYRCDFSSKNLTLYYEELDVEEGDKLIRVVPNKEESYTVHEVEYHNSSGFPPMYVLQVSKDAAIPKKTQPSTTNHINIHGSTGIQIGNHNVQNLEVALKEVLASIDNADAPKEEREEAKNRLNAFLAHPLVAAAVGGALPVALGLLS